MAKPLEIGLQADEAGQPQLVERFDEALVARPRAAAERRCDREGAGADPGGVVAARTDAVPGSRAAGVVCERAAIGPRPAVAQDQRQPARIAEILGVQE